LKYKDKDYLFEQLVINQKGIMQVAEEAGCTYITLRNWCKKLGVEIKSKTQLEIERLSDDIVKMYTDSNMLEKDIAKQLDTTINIVRKSLEYKGVEKRTRFEANEITRNKDGYYNRKFKLNENFFDEWSNDMAYILGLISSDGAILKGKKSYSRWKIAFKNDESNIQLLEQVKDKIMYEGDLHYSSSKLNGKSFDNVTLSINSLKMVNKLFEYGITNQKSLTIKMPIGIPQEYVMDFIRGYFDGDGSIAITYPSNKNKLKTKTPQLRCRIVSGSQTILEEFSEVINHLSGNIIPLKNVSQVKKNLYELEYSTFASMCLYSLMYKDDCISLNRKREVFEECIRSRSQ
jgi:hypothetical protein